MSGLWVVLFIGCVICDEDDGSRIASIPEETDIFEHPILHSTELSGSGFYQDCDTYILSKN
jgi:hypothetical protein